MHDLQKASMLKRISAYLFDLILLMVAISGAAFALSAILGFVNHFDKYEAITDKYLNEYEAAEEFAKDICKRLIKLEEKLEKEIKNYL